MKSANQAGKAFQELVEVMDRLRSDCPWDKKQTLQSLQKYTIEEMYELVDAINENNLQDIKEELGDILFHTIFYAKIGSETNDFTITDVIADVQEKLIRRHPHVFGEQQDISVEQVKRNWEAIKLKEGKQSILQGVPKALPAMTKAFRVQEKAGQAGFDWENKKDVWAKLEEELDEFKEAEQTEVHQDIEEEFGDVLFSMVNYARHANIDPEACLEKANQKFITRFQFIEDHISTESKPMNEYSIEELEKLWQFAKTSKKLQ